LPSISDARPVDARHASKTAPVGWSYFPGVRRAFSRSRRHAGLLLRRGVSIDGETVLIAIACIAAALVLYAVALLVVGSVEDDTEPFGALPRHAALAVLVTRSRP